MSVRLAMAVTEEEEELAYGSYDFKSPLPDRFPSPPLNLDFRPATPHTCPSSRMEVTQGSANISVISYLASW